MPGTSTTVTIGTELFVPELQFATDHFDQAKALCDRELVYRRVETTLDLITVDEDFRLTVSGTKYDMTENAFDGLCAVLAIPLQFARQVTLELFGIIVDRLGRLHQQAVVIVIRETVIVGVVNPAKWSHTRANATSRPHFEPVRNIELLTAIEKFWNDRGDVHIVITDAGVAVDVIDQEKIIEPKVGDVVRVGASITGSETGGPAPVARGYTFRLACSNGAIVPTAFGSVRFSTDWRVRHERRLEVFGAELAEFLVDVDDIRSAYADLIAGELGDQRFWILHRQAAYIYRRLPGHERIADGVLGVDEDHRKALVRSLRQRQEVVRRRPHESFVSMPSGLNLWDVHNSITAAARKEVDHGRRVALERLGGEMLTITTEARQPSGEERR